MADNDIWNCAKCKKETTEDYNYTSALITGNQYRYDKLCAECFVHAWDTPIKFVFDYGLPEWVEPHMKSVRVLKNIRNWFNRFSFPCVVHFVPRKVTETVSWNFTWMHEDNVVRGPFSYRGFCRYGTIVVIVDADGIETPESIEWITYHELGHHECQRMAKMADCAWNAENTNEGRIGYEWEEDAGHEADSEEKHVNRMATAFMGGKEYARPWWRKRVNAFLEGKPVEEFPNCHATPPKIEYAELMAIKPAPIPPTVLALQNFVKKSKKKDTKRKLTNGRNK